MTMVGLSGSLPKPNFMSRRNEKQLRKAHLAQGKNKIVFTHLKKTSTYLTSNSVHYFSLKLHSYNVCIYS